MLPWNEEWMRVAVCLGYGAAAAALGLAIGPLWLAVRPGYRLRWRPDVPASSPPPRAAGRFRTFRDRLLAGSPDRIAEYAQLLREAGIPVSAAAYLTARRTATASILTAAALFAILPALGPLAAVPWIAWVLSGSALAFAAGDRVWIRLIARRRSGQIAGEMHAICRQLLYLAGSRMSLHAKLARCTPHARRMRRAWLMLLHEWYEDPGEALYRFRHRVGTADAHGFAETLNAIRQNEYDGYYELLKRRIRDFRARTELERESRKESFSYVLFVLAGVPILNTFRVFVYPWMEAGRRLFESLQ